MGALVDGFVDALVDVFVDVDALVDVLVDAFVGSFVAAIVVDSGLGDVSGAILPFAAFFFGMAKKLG